MAKPGGPVPIPRAERVRTPKTKARIIRDTPACQDGLMKLRRSTEFAMAYPDAVIKHSEASAILDYIQELGGHP